jgi:hypothetical protein
VRQLNSLADGIVRDGIVRDGIVRDGRDPPTATLGRAVRPGAAAKPITEVAASLPSLPVGGVVPLTDNPSCVQVGWSGNPIPDGVRIMITGVDVKGDNGDVHEASGVSCQPSCHDYVLAAGTGGCQVAVGWTPNSPTKELWGTIGLDGKCIAPDQPTCDQMKATLASHGGRVSVFVQAKNASSASSEPPSSEPPSSEPPSSEPPSSEPSANGGS